MRGGERYERSRVGVGVCARFCEGWVRGEEVVGEIYDYVAF